MSARREHRGRRIEHTVHLDASEDEVFEAWADPDLIARWFPDKAEGRAESGAVVTWTFDGFFTQPVPVVAAEPPHYLAYGGEIPGRPPFLLTVEIAREREGQRTTLRLVNSGFVDGDDADLGFEGMDSGWQMALATLAQWIGKYRNERRTRVLAMLPADFMLGAHIDAFTTRAGLERWLGARATLSCEGERFGAGARVRLETAAGVLDGEVLVRTPFEVLVSWPQRRGTIGLKAFAGPSGNMVALDFNTWGGDAKGVREAADVALAKLATELGRAVVRVRNQ